MKFKLEVERHPETNHVLAIYLRLREGEVARTVEVHQDECYADEDASGQLLGVEMLAPGGHLIVHIGDIENRYREQPEINLLLKEAMEAIKAESLV